MGDTPIAKTMADFITAMQTTFTNDKMWEVIVGAGAFIGSMIVFAFGYRVVRRLVGGASKGKVKL